MADGGKMAEMDETLDLTLLCEQCDKHSCVCEDWIMKNDTPQGKVYSDGRGGLYEMSTRLYPIDND